MIPFVTLQLDKVYNLRFGMSAMVQFEQLTGLKITEIDETSMSAEICSKLLWAMLLKDYPEMTIEQVCELVDEHADNMLYVITTVSKAVNAAFEVKGGSKNAKTTVRKNT